MISSSFDTSHLTKVASPGPIAFMAASTFFPSVSATQLHIHRCHFHSYHTYSQHPHPHMHTHTHTHTHKPEFNFSTCFFNSSTHIHIVLNSWLDTIFVTLFPTTVERASCKVHKLLCTGWLSITIISIVLVVAVLLAFKDQSTWNELFINHTQSPVPKNHTWFL